MENKVYRNGRTIFLSGEIDGESSGELINELLTLIKWDDEQDETQKGYERKPISLYIKSNGGVVNDMFGIIDIIENSKTEINTYALGLIASAAVPLFLIGKRRYIFKNTEVMIHNVYGGVRGTIQDIGERFENIEKTQKMVNDYILSKTNITEEKLKEIREKKLDWYLYADEAIKLGIADEII